KNRAGGRKRPGPRPWGLYAVAFEVLAQFPNRLRQVDLARNLDLSQGLVSRALHTVHKIASPTDDDPRPAIAQWLRENYPTASRRLPPGGRRSDRTIVAPPDRAGVDRDAARPGRRRRPSRRSRRAQPHPLGSGRPAPADHHHHG